MTDSKPGIIRSIQDTLAEFEAEQPSEPELEWCIGPPMREVFTRLLRTDDTQTIEAAFAFYLECYSRRGIHQSQLYSGIPEMLAVLRARGLRMFVTTSKLTANAERVVQMFSIGDFFEAVLGCERDGPRADKRGVVAAILDRYRLARDTAAIVGDRRHDIDAGKANGIFTIGVTYGYGTFEELRAAGADCICASPLALGDLLA